MELAALYALLRVIKFGGIDDCALLDQIAFQLWLWDVGFCIYFPLLSGEGDYLGFVFIFLFFPLPVTFQSSYHNPKAAK